MKASHDVCKEHGHNFVQVGEYQTGKKASLPVRVYCTKCGQVKTL